MPGDGRFYAGAVFLIDNRRICAYNKDNRTSRTSPRQRVMCPREDIFISGGGAMTQLKNVTTYQEQLEILKARNVSADDDTRCLRVLETVNYYRFTAYFLPFREADGTYRPGTSFEKVYRIYEFDRKLRGILLSALEEVEIYLRAKFAYFHAHKYGAEGYMDSGCFSSEHRAEEFNSNFQREVLRNSRSAFVRHHLEQYEGHFPVWVAVELFSFGMLSRFYSDLITEDRKHLARDMYGATAKKMISWLRCCTDLRNICAHYGRLYYRIFPAMPAGVDADGRQKRQLWGAVLALRGLYPEREKWNSAILPELSALFEAYQKDISLRHLGFPDDWEDRLLMSRKEEPDVECDPDEQRTEAEKSDA